MNWEVADLRRGPIWGIILESGEQLRQHTKYFISRRPEIWTREVSIRNNCGKNFSNMVVGGGGVNFKDAVATISNYDAGFFL